MRQLSDLSQKQRDALAAAWAAEASRINEIFAPSTFSLLCACRSPIMGVGKICEKCNCRIQN